MNFLPEYQLFVYGSLRKGFHQETYEYIRRYFDFLSDAKVCGTLYDMGTYPAAVPSGKDPAIIGELYRIREIDEFEWAMGQLDDYEGVDPEDNRVPAYRREKVTVWLPDSRQTVAWIYWFNGDITGKQVIASGDVFQYFTGRSGFEDGI